MKSGAILFLLVLISSALLVSSSANANLLLNPGFESGITDWDPPWGMGNYTVEATTVDAHTGSKSLLITADPGDLGMLYQRVNGVVGSMYTVGAWAKLSSGNNSAELKLEFHSNPSSKIIDYILPIAATGTWTYHSY